MKCPIDGSELRISERQGIEIDYCPQCRGIWLDRGELDKLLDRTAQIAPYAAAPPRDRDAERPADRSADRSADRYDAPRRDDDRRCTETMTGGIAMTTTAVTVMTMTATTAAGQEEARPLLPGRHP